MRVFFLSLLILSFKNCYLFQNTAYAQTAVAKNQAKKEPEETKDQKFLNNGGFCLISKKVQDEAKDYIIGPMENDKLKLKVALTLTQLSIINKLKFEDINCGLRYFLELFYEKNGRRWDHRRDFDSWNSNLIFEYIKIIELVRTDLNYKSDFEKTIVNSSDLNFYFGIMDRIPDSYTYLDPGLARKVFCDNIMSNGLNRNPGSEEIQVFFDLFYSKGISPQKS